MIDPLDPLLTWADLSPGQEVDVDQEIQRLFQRQQALDRLVAGQMDTNDYLDLLDSHGLDVDRYVDLASNNIQKVIHEEIPVDQEAIIFYLPE